VSVTEKLFRPLLSAASQPLITYYDDLASSRVELSRATVANWAAKTANWLRDDRDVEPGTNIAVLLPAHWQTVGILLGAWWCGAHITPDHTKADVVFVAPKGKLVGAPTVAVVGLDPLGRRLAEEPGHGMIDYLNEVPAYGDDFTPWEPIPGEAKALADYTVDDVVAAAKERAAQMGLSAGVRVMSTLEWSSPDRLIVGLLAILAADGSLVQCANPDPAKMSGRRTAEHATIVLGNPEESG